MKTFCITYFFLLCIVGAYLAPMHAQESCYEQYLREHNKKILTAEDADDSYDELKKTVLAKQMYGDSYLLMVDTIAQRAMITKVDGTYIADVHLTLVDSTWYMWLSVDPLADKYPGNTPYMYCNGNPIMMIDPDGETWTDADGNEIEDHSKIRAYIFYKPGGSFSDGFAPQAMDLYEMYEKIYGEGTVALSAATTMSEFSQDWGDMAGLNIKEVVIMHHGRNQSINLNPDKKNAHYITSTGDGKTNISGTKAINVQDLPIPRGNISGATLRLNTCHSNDYTQVPIIRGSTLLRAFRNSFDFNAVVGTRSGVNYYWFSPRIAYPAKNGYWDYYYRDARNTR